MTSTSAGPGYRIREISELTGVPTSTLRAWERRYGVPSPRRSAAGYRLYTEADLTQIRELRRVVDTGVAPSAAVARMRDAAPLTPPPIERDAFALCCERIVASVVRFDPDELERELRRALVLGSTADAYERVMVPVMHEVGARWLAGGLSVAQEHLATELLRAAAQDLHRLSQPSRPDGLAVLACFADELHVLPLYGIAFRLNRAGLRTLVLGARTPPEAIAMAVDRLKPVVVGLSVTVTPEATRAAELVAAYGDACEGTPWLVGGSGAEPLRGAIEARGGIVNPALDGGVHHLIRVG